MTSERRKIPIGEMFGCAAIILASGITVSLIILVLGWWFS